MKHDISIKTAVCQCICAIVVCALSSSSAWALGLRYQAKEAKALSHYMMGVMYDLSGLSAFAVHEYEQAVHHQDDVALSRLRLGSNYARIGRLEDADKQLSKAAILNPNDLQARYLLALIYSTQRKFDQAASEYEAILKSFSKNDPKNIEIHVYLGQLYYSQQQYDKALTQFEHIVEIDLDNTDVMYLLSSLYLEEEDRRDDAVELLQQCISVESKHAGCFNSIAYIYAEDNIKLDLALEYIQEALSHEPKNGAYLDTLAWVYYRKGMYVEALKKLDEASEMIEDYVIYDHMGDVYLALKRPEEAKKYWRKALELMPEEGAIQEKLSQIEKQSAKKE